MHNYMYLVQWQEFNPMEEPEPRWDVGTCNNDAQTAPASPSKPVFAHVDAAGLSCMSPGPRCFYCYI